MRVAIVVVLYNPDPYLFSEISKTYKKNADFVYICDNSTMTDLKKKIALICSCRGFDYHDMKGNRGLAKAQNIGIYNALNIGADYILFMDQDSEISDDYVDALLNEYMEILKYEEKCACIAPVSVNANNIHHVYTKGLKEEERFFFPKQVMNSGLLIPSNFIVEVGLMEEKLFIDLIDYEWSWRLLSKGYKIGLTNNVRIYHHLGDGHLSFIGMKVGVSSPIRLYYMFRNSFAMLFRSYVPIKWKLSFLLKAPIKMVLNFVLMNDSIKRMKYIIAGVADFFLNRYGKYGSK